METSWSQPGSRRTSSPTSPGITSPRSSSRPHMARSPPTRCFSAKRSRARSISTSSADCSGALRGRPFSRRKSRRWRSPRARRACRPRGSRRCSRTWLAIPMERSRICAPSSSTRRRRCSAVARSSRRLASSLVTTSTASPRSSITTSSRTGFCTHALTRRAGRVTAASAPSIAASVEPTSRSTGW